MRKILFLLLTSILAIGLVACDDEVKKKEVGSVESSEKEEENIETVADENPEESDQDTVEEDEPEAKEDEEAKAKEKEDVPREHQNALKSAQNYIDMMAFSEKGLYEQLTSDYGDQYPEEAAKYAIDNVEVDYNEEALKAAENYQEIMPMSDQELFEQLTSEYGDQYTEEQAQYALDNLSD